MADGLRPWKIKNQALIHFFSKLSTAISNDIQQLEQLYPKHEHIVLCGGKDSLNILLLPWAKPVIVASSKPNYELVARSRCRSERK